MVVRRLGGGPVLLSQYQYSPWSVQGGRLEKLKAGSPANPTALLDFSYSYDPVGNILAIGDSKAGGAQTQSFEYDDLDRLTSATASGGTQGLYSEDYSYATATGNLSSKGGITYAYDPEHPHAVASTSNGSSYQYDGNGNQIQRIIGGVTTTLEYDEENRLKAVKQGTTTLAEFVYDGDGVRVKGTVGGVTTTYIGNYLEWTGSTSTMKRYYYAGGIRVAMRVGSTQYYLLGDHLGSTSVVATSSGGLQSKVLYKAWGEDRYISGTLPTGHRYTGQYKDNSINLSWYGSRWYDDSLGRFIQPDPIIPEPYNPLAYDRYQYVYSNPIRYTDNSGYCIDGISTWVCIGVVVGVISKVVDYGWTVYDAWKSGQILNDPNASQVEKDEAAANLAMAATF